MGTILLIFVWLFEARSLVVKRKFHDDDTDALVRSMGNDETRLTWKIKKRLLDLQVDYPKCVYPENSRRNLKKHMNADDDDNDANDCAYPDKLSDYLKTLLTGFNTSKIICIDGMNGTGKSTITSEINRRYCKINEYCPTVTAGADYNYYIMNALQYINYQIVCTLRDDSVPIVWDRDRYSNLRFYFVHYLMNEYQNRVMSIKDEHEVYEKLNTMALATHLLETLTYYEKWKPSPPTLVLVCSDLELLGHILMLRGGVSGTVMAKITNYQMAQYHVYRYFAKILNTPLLDIATVSKVYNVTLNTIQTLVMNYIDYDNRVTTLYNNNDDNNHHDDDEARNEAFVRLQEFCKRNNDRALYTYSLK